MQVAKLLVRNSEDAQPAPVLSEKELVLLSEIGLDQIPSASSFVSFVSEQYGLSQSGVWYILKKLKQKRVVDFTEKGEGQRPLALTGLGIKEFRQARNGQYGTPVAAQSNSTVRPVLPGLY